MKTTYFDGDRFERNGHVFKVEFPFDCDAGAPWENCDGHGPVSDWTCRNKKPGERVLASDRSSKRYYDFAEATRIAKRDGWGLSAEKLDELTKKLGKKPSRKQITAQAVENDFEYLRAWCNDEWHYVGVIVHLLDADEETGREESLWGVEYIDGEYPAGVAHELADTISAQIERDELQAKIENRFRDAMDCGL